MNSTQQFIPIKDIRNDLLILKDGTISLVLKTSAVNFGLLSENEQLAIIGSFAGMLNSLSFAIQIVIRSKRLDISLYLKRLNEALKKQTNPLLVQMINRYKFFIENTIRENEVLDKQFYIVIPLSYLEVGISSNIEANFPKVLASLIPRRDHLIRQLAGIGLKSNQLNTRELIDLFYDIYNSSVEGNNLQGNLPMGWQNETNNEDKLKILDQDPMSSAQIQPTQGDESSKQLSGLDQNSIQVQDTNSIDRSLSAKNEDQKTGFRLPTYIQQSTKSSNQINPLQSDVKSANLTSPFVVEELPDDYGVMN